MNPLSIKWIDEIFNRFRGRFGNSFISMYSLGVIGKNGVDEGIEDAKRVWSQELAGFTADEIRRGLSAEFKFMPNCDEFKLACRPTMDYEQSFLEAVKQYHNRKEGKDTWSSAVVYWAATVLGNDLNNNPYQSIKGRWKAAYDDAREKVADGRLPNEVPEKLVAISKPGNSISKEEGMRRFAEIKKILEKEPEWKKKLRDKTTSKHIADDLMTGLKQGMGVEKPSESEPAFPVCSEEELVSTKQPGVKI
jgi:hypothetical protein